jgi:hypothetical protein
MPGSVEFYEARYPGFPPYVHELFAAKARGPEAEAEFLENTARPFISTHILETDPVEPDGVVEKKVEVNWF